MNWPEIAVIGPWMAANARNVFGGDQVAGITPAVVRLAIRAAIADRASASIVVPPLGNAGLVAIFQLP